jgi:hypothetical protein
MAGAGSVKWCVQSYNFTGIITDMHLNEVMDASCEPLDLILLPGMCSLVCQGV